jgi:DNA end-binding protein Ku
MAPRANWKGYLKLSLVSCPVALFPATTTSERVRFNIVNRKTGNRVRYDVVDAETGAEVPQQDRVKGYKADKTSYVLLEEDELDNVALESTHTIDIESFVPRDQVDQLYLDESYYLTPADEVGIEAFAVIRDAMRKENLVGLARVVLYRRERLLMLWPRGKGVVGTLLRYNSEVRDASDYFDDIPDVKVPKDMLELAEHILQSKKTRFRRNSRTATSLP